MRPWISEETEGFSGTSVSSGISGAAGSSGGTVSVTSVEPVGKGKARVSFDNGTSCLLYRGEMRSFAIHETAVLTELQYESLLRDVVGKRAKKRAMHLLEQMDRTEEQLRSKLLRSEYPQKCVEEAIDYVKAYHYLDDYRYACNFIRCFQEKYSRRQLQMKLQQKGVARDLIERALEETYESDESEQILALLAKRHYDPEQADEGERRRMYQYLLRRGFSSSIVLKNL
jgi:regulatory protein